MNSHSYINNKKNSNILININGDLFERKDAKISVFDSGFLLGDGVWEGIRLQDSRLLFVDDHIDRLFKSASGISIKISLSKSEIINEIYKVISANNMKDDVHIRLIVTRGDKITPYQNPKANVGGINYVIIPEYKKTDSKIYRDGIVIGRVKTIRPSADILNTHYNTLSKLNCIQASIEANHAGFDEGIMNDPNGFISTCNSTNLFFIKKNEVWTSTGDYCLNGITRKKAIEICNSNNIPCFQRNFKFENIKDCNEAFVTGTFAGIIPVKEIENKKLNSTSPESLVNKLRNLYQKKVLKYIENI